MADQILIIEDEANIARLLSLELRHEGYEVETANNGQEGLEKAIGSTWDLILLDVMLPKLNGIEVLRRIRKLKITTPIILLTARDSIPDKVVGLDQGASDYITKPFEIEELLARIRASIRSHNAVYVESNDGERSSNELTVDGLHVNTKTREIVREGQYIELTPKEYDLLTYMMEHKNEVLSREQLISNVWKYDFMGDTNIVDVYIRYLRKKIDYDFGVQLIQTIRGVGYSIKESEKL